MVARITKAILWALLANSLDACQRARKHVHSKAAHKRSLTPRAPLTADEQLIISSFDNNSISDWEYYYTHRVHIAGKNVDEAQWTADRFAEAGIPYSFLSRYNVFLNYPVSKSLVVTLSNGSTFEPNLEEDVLPEDPTTGLPNRIPTFHGYSFSGEAEAEYVYVGRGQKTDFDSLVKLGVPLEGKIALAMYGGPFRGLKVKNSQEYGMIGTVIFTDPIDDGEITVANGYTAYPDGPARNPSSVQRGSVEFLSIYAGDPTTPGYPSIGDPERTDGTEVLPSIPSIPISYANAQPLLAALNGQGYSTNKTGLQYGALDAQYFSGPAPGVSMSMSNQMDDTFGEIANTIGVINGTDPTQTLLVGNHRDAWIIGGAADPNSGTAVLVELAYVMGDLLKQGWQPRTNIVICSWDAEEYGLVGSTEWMEEYIPWLSESAVSYLNIDVAVDGPVPYIAGTPELHEVAIDTMKKVPWYTGDGTLYDAWFAASDGEVGVLGSGSDYTGYLDHIGIASLDMGSDPGDTDPVYHYHSNYDSYYWMTNFGDPDFLVHTAMGQYLTLLTYTLASEPVLPLKPVNYADQMDIYYQDLLTTIKDAGVNLSTTALKSAIDDFRLAAGQTETEAIDAGQSGDAAAIAAVNEKLTAFQRGFTSQGGLPNREFFRHLIFAPGLDTGYEAVTFPGITEAITMYNDLAMAKEFVVKTSAAIEAAASVLAS